MFKHILGSVLVLSLVVLGGFFWWQVNTTAVNPQSLSVSKAFVVRKGENLSFVAQHLKQEDLIRSSLAFKLMILTRGLAGKIQAGSFQLSPSLSVEEIAFELIRGTSDIWLTFPEGWRKEEFGQRLKTNLENFDSQEFLLLVEHLEGFLFPDTYLISRQASSSAVVKMFRRNFDRKFNLELELAAKSKGLTKNEVVILASIVERETKHEEDRSIVAGILIKRWQNNWPFQVDATLQYIKANQNCFNLSEQSCNWWPLVAGKDKKINSPYNTYQYKGLPPAPICNPGLASIRAVIYPQETAYWFYLSDEKGKMHYAETIEEHDQNVVQYLKAT